MKTRTQHQSQSLPRLKALTTSAGLSFSPILQQVEIFLLIYPSLKKLCDKNSFLGGTRKLPLSCYFYQDNKDTDQRASSIGWSKSDPDLNTKNKNHCQRMNHIWIPSLIGHRTDGVFVSALSKMHTGSLPLSLCLTHMRTRTAIFLSARPARSFPD